MADFLCNLQIDGYLTDTMNTEAGGSFHREIVICNPKDKLEYVKQITDNERADLLKKEWKLKQIELQDKENRKKKKPIENEIQSDENDDETKPGFFANLFGTNDDDEGYKTPGGAKNKKNKKNKKKKSKKWIKYNKRHTKRKLVKKG